MAWTASPLPPVDDPTAPPVSPPPPPSNVTETGLPPGPGVPSLATTPVPGSMIYGNSVLLSDGQHAVEIPPNLSGQQIAQEIREAQHALDLMYGAQARETGAPVHPGGDRVYSATRWYPNNAIGKSQAWIDHNLGGNWANTNLYDPANRFLGGGLDTTTDVLKRGGINLLMAESDIGTAGYNALQEYLNPGNRDKQFTPFSSDLRKELGVPDMPATASTPQRLLEGALPMVLGGVAGGKGLFRSAVAGGAAAGGSEVGSNVGGDIAEKMLGPNARRMGQVVGGVAGGGAPSAARMSFLTAPYAAATRHPEAANIYDAIRALDLTPTYRSLAGPTGQRTSASLESLPIVGTTPRRANEALSRGLEARVQEAAREVAGPGGIPVTGATPRSIGANFIEGAREATAGGPRALGTEANPLPDLRTQRDQLYDPINQVMTGAYRPVNVAPIAAQVERRLTDPATETTGSFEDAIRARLNDIRDKAPGGARYTGPDVPLPTQDLGVGWNTTRDWRAGLRRLIQSGEAPEEYVTQMRNAATEALGAAADRFGMGDAWRNADRYYAERIRPMLQQLYKIGGRPTSDGGFTPAMGEETASRVLTGNINSPNKLEPFLNPANFPVRNWRSAAGQYLSMLGRSPQGTTRPEHIHRDWNEIDPQVQLQLTEGAPGAHQTFENAATAGANYSTPTSRHGLTGAMGAMYAVHQALEAAKKVGEKLGIPGAAQAFPALLARGVAGGLEDPSMHRLMARPYTLPLEALRAVANTFPTSGPMQTDRQRIEDERKRIRDIARPPADARR